MKISTYIQLLVLLCLGVGLSIFLLLSNKYIQLDNANVTQQQMQTGKNGMDITQTMLRQWYTTIDLYYSDRQISLAQGIKTQTEQLLNQFNLLEKTLPNDPQLQKLLTRISTESDNITQSAFKQAQDSQQWSNQLTQSDDNTTQIAALFDSLTTVLQNKYKTAEQHSLIIRQQFHQQALFLVIAYIFTVITAGYWTSQTIIKPLQKLTQLTQLTGNDPIGSQIADLQLKKGPVEVQLLSNSFNKLYQRINSEMKEALKSRAAEQRIKDRLEALVNNVSSSIITIDTDGFINNFNPATPDLFALPEEQLNGTQITQLLPSLNIRGGLFNQMLNAGVDIELDAIVGKNFKPVEISCAELNFSVGEQSAQQFILIVHDISNRKKNEDRVKALNQRLISISRQAGIAEIATSILHSVGNVLNSVNTSVAMLQQGLEKDQTKGLDKTAEMFKQQGAELFTPLGKGPQLIDYLYAVAKQFEENKQRNLLEVASLKQNVSHIAEIVSSQQKFSGKSGIIQSLNISELLEEALNINVVSIESNQVKIQRNFPSSLEIMGDRSKIVQIFVNLIRNANEAMMTPQTHPAKITLSANIINYTIVIVVADNGQGISEENADNMFRYGFTTKENGHGFGLHSCALAAKEMQGSLTVHSDGENLGAIFTLTLPIDPALKEAHDIKTFMTPPIENSHEA